MPPAHRENLLRILETCRKQGVFHPRVDAGVLALDRRQIDAALDQLRTGGFVEIADWVADKGQGYRLTPAGDAALVDPRRLDKPAPVQAPAVERSIRLGSEDRWSSVIESLLHPKPPIVTMILIFLNVAVFFVDAGIVALKGGSAYGFLIGQVPHTQRDIIDLGQLWGELRLELRPVGVVVHNIVHSGDWWRLLTYMFLHSGVLHIGCNMYVLYALGTRLEGRLGWWRYLILYLGSGLIAGVVILMFEAHVIVVGASGAICGVMTSLAAWAWLLRRYLPPEYVQANLRAVAINVIILAMIGSSMSVSNAGHAGGAIGGILLTIPILLLDRRAPMQQRIGGVALLAAIAIGTVGLVVYYVIPSLS